MNNRAVLYKSFRAEVCVPSGSNASVTIGLRLTEQFFHIRRIRVDGLNIADALCGGVVVFAIALDLNRSQQSGNVLFDTAHRFSNMAKLRVCIPVSDFSGIAAQMDTLAPSGP